MTEQGKPDLSKIEPIGGLPPEEDESPSAARAPEPESLATAAGRVADEPPAQEPRTSPETENELDKLRRG